MTAPRVQRGLDAAIPDTDLARIAQLRQRARAVGLPLDASEAEIAKAETRLPRTIGQQLTAQCECGTYFNPADEPYPTKRHACLHEAAFTPPPVPDSPAKSGSAKPVGYEIAGQLSNEPEPRLERDVEIAGDKLMQGYGFTPIRLSQRRRSKVTLGLPDRLYMHPVRRLFVFWEAKAPDGKQRPKQAEFQALCDATGVPYVLGGVQALKDWFTRTLEAGQ